MSSTNIGVDELNKASSIATLILTFGSFIPGCIGHILNVIIFVRPSLRCHSCTNYFLSSSIVSLFLMLIVLPVRIASNSFNRSLSDWNEICCKMEYFLFYCARSLSCWLIVLVCIDRCIHSSGNQRWRRILNSKKIVISTIILTSLFIVIGYIHMPIFYNLVVTVNVNGQISSYCASQRGFYRTFITFWHITVYALGPSSAMLLFGVITLYNIRQRRLRIGPNNPQSNRRNEGQLLRMLLVQVLVIILTTVPGQIVLIYQTLTSSESKNAYRMAQERFALQLLGGLSYISHASGFYLYTLTGSLFRKELILILSKFLHLFCKNPNRSTTATTINVQPKSENNQLKTLSMTKTRIVKERSLPNNDKESVIQL